MTPVEKIYSEERENRSVIILRPEGMFYRAYEHSAYLVCKSIREFKPTKRFYKNIGQEIVSIGFPKDTYSKYVRERTAVVDSDGTVRVQSGMELDEGLFKSWKQSLPLASAKESRHPFEGDRIQVYRESYALMMKVFDSLVNVSRDFKQIPGEDIRRDSLNLVRSVLKANDARDVAGRIEEIGKALESVEDMTAQKLRAILNSYLGYMGHFSSFRYRRKFICSHPWLFRYGAFPVTFSKMILLGRPMSKWTRLRFYKLSRL